MLVDADADQASTSTAALPGVLPMVKPEHVPYRIAGDRLRIGGVVFGIAAEIPDPTGAVWALLQAMDGKRTVDEIIARVRETHPGCSATAVAAWVDQLAMRGYVEDAALAEPADLTNRDRMRHDRARRFYRWIDLGGGVDTWRPQRALRDARVCVIGIGGTGGRAAMSLAASGVGRLRLVDGDVVEVSNLGRQTIYTESDVGRTKVEAAADRLAALNSDIAIETARQTVAGYGDIAVLAADCDVLLLAADTPRDTRTWTNRACLATGTPWVDAGYHGPSSRWGSTGRTRAPAGNACVRSNGNATRASAPTQTTPSARGVTRRTRSGQCRPACLGSWPHMHSYRSSPGSRQSQPAGCTRSTCTTWPLRHSS